MWKYRKKKDGTIVLKEYLGNEEVVIIPAVYNGYEVFQVGDGSTSIFDSNRSKKIKKIIIEEGISFVNNILCEDGSLEEVQLPKSLQGIRIDTCREIAKLGFADLEFLPKYQYRSYPKTDLGCYGNWGYAPVYYPAADLKKTKKMDKIGLVLGYIEAVRRGKQIDEQTAAKYHAHIKRNYKSLAKEIGGQYLEKFLEFTKEYQLIPPSVLNAGTVEELQKLQLKGKK